MSSPDPTAGIAGQIKELFPILTKFVMGLAGAPYDEIVRSSDAPDALPAP